uniref:O-fucosyltransferase family protein n=1 Tax=Leersia perrieri TaxID=77586 RepID=A0A0D9XMG6_9ORYZ
MVNANVAQDGLVDCGPISWEYASNTWLAGGPWEGAAFCLPIQNRFQIRSDPIRLAGDGDGGAGEMDFPASRGRWRKRSARSHVPLLVAVLVLLVPASLLLSSAYSSLLRSILPFSGSAAAGRGGGGDGRMCGRSTEIEGERFLWYAPHSGFSNQVGELRNAAVAAALLNRTLVVPPVLDHHAVVLGSCPKFRVSDPADLRAAVWDHSIQLLRERRYVSMGDIIDLSPIKDVVSTIDFRVFVSLWCGVDMRKACFSGLCFAVTGGGSLSGDYDRCRSMLSGLVGSENECVYPVQDDCRTTVWTFQANNDGALDSFQPDEDLKRRKKIAYVRRRKDMYKALGPGSEADGASLLAFGTLFSGPYKGSESYFDIHESPKDRRLQTVLEKVEFLPFAPEIISAGKEFAKNKIKEPFLCAQLRLLDGQFKNHWKATFSALKEKLKAVEMEMKKNKGSSPINMFIMTDLPPTNWSKTYLADIAKDGRYKLHTLKESDELVVQTAERLMAAEHGVRSGFVPRNIENTRKDCDPVQLPEILLYVEESVCSCASLGFVGTAGSTIAGSIETMRKNNCFWMSYRKAADSLFLLSCWLIWKERNARVFDQQSRTAEQLFQEIKKEIMVWKSASLLTSDE